MGFTLFHSNSFGKHRQLRATTLEWSLGMTGAADEALLCRMADCVEPALSAKARTVVSNLRLRALRNALPPAVRLASAGIRTFDPAYSRQNFVLAATCAACSDD